ncbi:MAG: hypothetical protein WD749_11510 [Phycisphaerales bacterium]
MNLRLCIAILASASAALGQATPQTSAPPAPRERAQAEPALTRRTWTVEGAERLAFLHIPAPPAAAKTDTPVVFAFHGHGGNARQASRSFHIETEWPEAIVVYMEGLPTPGALTDPEGKRNGWQAREGLQDDRDLKFFDTVLASLRKEYKVDDGRIYAMGHSNGGAFTYLLWKTRAPVFAAFAPSGAYTGRAATLAPRPAMHIAGTKDELVKFDNQQRTIDAVKRVNGCTEPGKPWDRDCTRYDSTKGTPLVTLIYDGSHRYPAHAPALIVKFFKEQPEQAKPAPAQKNPG